MKKTTLLLSLLLATTALAARIEVPPGRALAPVESARKAEVLRSALSTFTLDDGSLWITHFAPAEREPGAIGITRFGADGTARLFLLSDWLPKGAIPRGRYGQIYAVTMLTDGRLAASGGWTDGRNSHNAVITLKPGKDGAYTTERIIELPGVYRLAAGPNNSIVVVTNDAMRRGGGPLLTIIDRNGAIVGDLFGVHASLSPVEASQNASDARLERVSENRMALYDPELATVIVFDLKVGDGKADAGGGFTRFIGDDATLDGTRVVGIDVTPDDEILVVRSGKIRGTFGTHLTIYDSRGGVKQSTTLDVPWNLMIRENDRIHGVVMRGKPHLDTIHLRAGK
jgi:hypothetical protein